MWKILSIALLALWPLSVLALDSCLLPAGTPALCVPIDNCRHIRELFKTLQSPLPPNVGFLIRDSYFCTNQGGNDLNVCCPLEGIETPANPKPNIVKKDHCTLQGGGEAECVLYSQCGPFVELLINLKRPFPPEVPGLMRNGWLCGLESSNGGRLPKICCPKAALKPVKQEPKNEFESNQNRNILAKSDDCGTIPGGSTRIVGGQDAIIGQYPWLANLGYTRARTGDKVFFKCGGTLIGERWVITAAHCVTGIPGGFKLTRIRLGEHDLRKDPDCRPGGSTSNLECSFHQDFNITKVIFHEEYTTSPIVNDIAIIKIDRPAIFNEFVRPVCLPFDDDFEESYVLPSGPKQFLTEVAGWGATTERGGNPADILQFLGLDVVDAEDCKEIYKDKGAQITPGPQMCAGGVKGQDSCVGDSGSALMREHSTTPSVWKLIGVVSFGPRFCGTEGVPGVYSRVRFYLDWILNNVD